MLMSSGRAGGHREVFPAASGYTQLEPELDNNLRPDELRKYNEDEGEGDVDSCH